jgi:cyclophilin family peptidyl-prolyl cis-trans isomerase/HEAT repeat protein
VAVLSVAGCASTPPAPPPPPTYEQKLTWILQLEDERILRLPPAPAAVTPAAVVAPTAPDLTLLLTDTEARVRRRASLAIGRVGLVEGIPPLARVLSADPDPEVRQMAAFALGLIHDASAAGALVSALRDSSPLVQGRAAQSLGLLDARDQASAIAAMASTYVNAGVLRGQTPDDLTYPLSAEVEAVRLAIYALARLKAYDALASVVLDRSGQPVTRWWPVAYALRRVDDPRGAAPLMALLRGEGLYTRAFAARGLGALKATSAIDALLPIAADIAREPIVGVEAVRALAELKAQSAHTMLSQVLLRPELSPTLRVEVLAALGSTGTPDDADQLLDLLTDRSYQVRAAAFKALGAIDGERLVTVLSGLDPDPDWRVRAAIATTLGTLPPEGGGRLLLGLADDEDGRVIAAVCAAMAAGKLPGAEPVLISKLQADDWVVRAAAASAVGDLKIRSAVDPLKIAFERAQRDTSYGARAAALAALVAIDPAAAKPLVEQAFHDKDWAVRVRAAELAKQIDPTRDTAAAIRPAPASASATLYSSPALVAPPYSTHVYLDTDLGTIEIELFVLDAPLTAHNFVTLARKGAFDGLPIHRVVANFVVQDGDPRGDGEGGPGYTIRDEINEQPYLRGIVGMALDWKDTGGSQYFITHSPQPHLDTRYTVFGHVVAGIDIVDRLGVGDTVRRVRVWDGVQ